MNRVFLTGSTGFLGKYLTRSLCNAGYEITVLSRSPNRSRNKDEGKIKTIFLPNAKLNDLDIALSKGYDVVCNLAAFVPNDHSDPSLARACIETNVMLSLNLLQASVRNNVKRYVYFSAGNAYAPDLDRPAKETDPMYPSNISPFYLGSKMLAEVFTEHYRRKHSLKTISLRISSPYGWGMPSKSTVIRFIQNTIDGLPIQLYDGGQHKTDLVFVEDVIDVTMAAIKSGSPGIYNIGSGVATSMLDLARLISRVFRREVPIKFVSSKAGGGGGFCALDIEKARSAWGWQPRSLRDGLQAMREEMKC